MKKHTSDSVDWLVVAAFLIIVASSYWDRLGNAVAGFVDGLVKTILLTQLKSISSL